MSADFAQTFFEPLLLGFHFAEIMPKNSNDIGSIAQGCAIERRQAGTPVDATRNGILIRGKPQAVILAK
jgi:hypothetical protein